MGQSLSDNFSDKLVWVVHVDSNILYSYFLSGLHFTKEEIIHVVQSLQNMAMLLKEI